jgi:5-methylcytosine-specific restriction endonuclease McrA
MRKTWHEDCATEYLLIYSSGEQRAQLWNRDKGICNHCGCFSMSWQADHIKPLVEQKGVKEEDLDWSYYKLENLQTLCKKCHRKKTNEEVVLKGKGKVNYKKII